ncbi:MAG: LCP family protein [Candidatus Dojkabacteria bacterium]|nr:LCP family protein [Candidatus Dojkabacteria bacterium]
MTIDIKENETLEKPKPPKNKFKIDTSDKKPKKKNKLGLIILIILVLGIFGAIGFLIYKGYIFTKDIGLNIKAGDIIAPQKDPELKRDSSGKYTNILIIGVDTRESGALLNTDTLILASYNYETNNIVMVSIPRDFNVEINGTGWYNRINSVYASAEKKAEGSGFEALMETVTEVTDQEVQYYAMINFQAFVDIVDAVGGVDINVENSFLDYRYPDGYGYKTISFEAGPQTMDGQTALEYARSRKSLQNNEGSDYARAKRQQKVIVALQEKIMSSETLINPQKLMEIFSSIAKNVKVSQFTLNDIQAGINIGKNYSENNGKNYSFVLDPAAGNYGLIQVKIGENGQYGIIPKLGLGKYTNIHKYTNNVILYPHIYTEDAKTYVYNTGLGYSETLAKTNSLKEKYPYLKITFKGNLYSNKSGSVIYSHTDSMYSKTVQLFGEYLNITDNTKPEYVTTNLNGEDVTILMGKPIQLDQTTN